MSPEPFNPCALDSPQDLPIDQTLEKAKCLKAIKSHDRVAKLRNDSNKPFGLKPSLPDPKPRSVAGHVSRERNRVSVAEAAPSNSQQSSKQQQHPRKHRRQGRQSASNKKDDGSGSDSEHHDDDADKNTGQSRRRPIQSQEDEDETMDDISSAALLREESERVRLLQTLTKVGSEWERVRSIRQHNQLWGPRRVKRLIRRYASNMDLDGHSGATSRMMGKLRVLDEEHQRRQEYLDDALCRHLEGKSQNTDADCSVEIFEHLEELIQRTELGVIRRCWSVDPYARSWDLVPPKAQFRLVRIVKGLYSATWNYLSARPQKPERSYQDDLVASCGFIEDKCRKGDLAQAETMIVDPVIDSYFAAMARELSEDVILDLREGRRRPDLDTLKMCEKILNSRHNDYITPEYSAWASSRLDPAEKGAILVKWNQDKQQEILTRFRRLMHSAKMSIRQEFCSDIVTPGVVSLVLFKEDWPSAIKDVTPDDLRNMGWVSEEHNNRSQFVRLELRTDDKEGREHIFKVSMDEEVLAVLRVDGRRWIYWDEKDFPLEQNK